MARRRSIYFDDPLLEDEVVIAVSPIDAFTGRIVRGPIECEIEDFPRRPIRNLSGLYVFVTNTNTPQHDAYFVRIKAHDAGYFDPKPFIFVPLDSNDSNDSITDLINARHVVVPLLKRPSEPYTDGETLISGVIIRRIDQETKPVANATVWGDLPGQPVPENPPDDTQFRTMTDERGAFCLALRVPDRTVNVTMHIRDEVGHRTISGVVEEHGRHFFQLPIDLSSPADPNFTWQLQRTGS